MQIPRERVRTALSLTAVSLVVVPLAFVAPLNAEEETAAEALVNSGFEDGGDGVPDGWTVASGDARISVVSDARGGEGAMRVSFDEDGSVVLRQVIVDQAAGAYDLTAWTRTDGLEGGAVALGDQEWRRTGIPSSTDWTQVTVRGVEATSGQLEVRFELAGAAGQSIVIDDVAIAEGGAGEDFLAGGDLTQLNYIEDLGGVFRDEQGRAVDPVEFMADNGMGIARLRMYNDTGPENHRIGYPGSYLADGYQDPEDVLDLARRAHDAGMQIQLTFHYSDYWSNGEIQDIPLEWRYVNDLPYEEAVAELERLMYDYTRDFLQEMVDQGTPPAYVALGNETAGGLLHPYGGSWQEGGSLDVMADFFTAASQAVHDTLPDAQVIIHLDDAGNRDKYEWYFGELERRGVPYDVIGSSYYPYWTQLDVETVAPFFQWANERFDKPVMIMETGFNWTPLTHEGREGQLNDNGPYGEDPISQRDFFRELFAAVKALPPGTVIGDIYWDPIFLGVPGAGWEVGQPNYVSNSTVFDFDGVALPVFQAYRENAASPRETIAVAGHRPQGPDGP
ncbi:glycosyl hydrolase 53 family protein [Allonocardiopsis opalescens]|uniref:Arabinogalactan endo-beta-1,4-galactanase n=1 Tax=Allonocardiopsis opalescens TaxID=1144618 RepID=A0A2T0QFD3_9ACTN|nr:glycosyl hydrolase 53 family protein [Allonocardiopsis opalescens]PRY02561.1 arabinogalactan endo-1,4-beta-galactosidase [Allonocardiopsis opalescens]